MSIWEETYQVWHGSQTQKSSIVVTPWWHVRVYTCPPWPLPVVSNESCMKLDMSRWQEMLECWFPSWHGAWLPECISDGLIVLAYVNSSFTPGGEWTKYIVASWSQKWSNNFVVQRRLRASTLGGEWRSPEWEIDEIPSDVRIKMY